jgi:hypothetical protein
LQDLTPECLKEVIRTLEESSINWKGRNPCAIVNLHLLGDAKVDGVNLFSCSVYAILGGVFLSRILIADQGLDILSFLAKQL